MLTMPARDTDSQLRDAVLRQLERDPRITSPDINVAITDKVVTLTGYVHTYAEKYAAQKAVERVHGVQALANGLQVTLAHTDPEIARDAVHAMQIDAMVPNEKIKTIINEGIVTLDGTVDGDFQRRRAESCVRNLAVRGVVNQIQAKPSAGPRRPCVI
jgi:osmotically-inducible protein OsmY